MCDVCNKEGLDYKFKNGDDKLYPMKLHKVFVGRVVNINVCKLHSIELFRYGEISFLRNHIEFAQSLAGKSNSFDSDDDFF